MSKRKISIVSAGLALFSGFVLLGVPSVYANTVSVTANISFDAPLSLTKNNDIQFGTVLSSTPGRYVIDTQNQITASSGGVWAYGAPLAASLTIMGSSTQSVRVFTGSYLASNGVTPSHATCKLGGGAAADCDAGVVIAGPGVPIKLLVGVQVDADGTQSSGSAAAPTFNVTVLYD